MSKPIKILYDPQMFDLQMYGGISRYFTNLIEGINRRSDFTVSLPIVYSQNYYARNFSQLLNNKIGRKWLKKIERRKTVNKYYAKQLIKRSNFDLFHASYYDTYFLKDLKKPLVVTVHDMIHENYPDLFTNSKETIQQKKTTIEAADLIISISQYTKEQILKHYPTVEHKVKVVYHGLPTKKSLPSNDTLPKRFLLYVGDRSAGYKNFVFMINACAPLLIQNPDLHIICAGGNNFSEHELNSIKQLGILGRVIQINATDALIDQLYKQAIVFIYPSLEEGFGLPMLEAFRNGCAIACSNTSCLPEVGGQAVAYFNPESQKSIQLTVANLIENNTLRNEYIRKGYLQLEKFTFENCLKQTLDCYKLVLNK